MMYIAMWICGAWTELENLKLKSSVRDLFSKSLKNKLIPIVSLLLFSWNFKIYPFDRMHGWRLGYVCASFGLHNWAKIGWLQRETFITDQGTTLYSTTINEMLCSSCGMMWHELMHLVSSRYTFWQLRDQALRETLVLRD